MRFDNLQMKAARALLEWNQHDLAAHAKLSVDTVKRVEKNGLGRLTLDNVEKLEAAFENAGIEFIDGGVRLVR